MHMHLRCSALLISLAVAGGDRGTIKEFCAQKAAAAASVHANDEVETWTFLGVMFEEDARRQLLSKLGFSEVLAGTGVARTQSVGLNAAADHLAAATEQLRMSADGEHSVTLLMYCWLGCSVMNWEW
jgi:hypothetical protein